MPKRRHCAVMFGPLIAALLAFVSSSTSAPSHAGTPIRQAGAHHTAGYHLIGSPVAAILYGGSGLSYLLYFHLNRPLRVNHDTDETNAVSTLDGASGGGPVILWTGKSCYVQSIDNGYTYPASLQTPSPGQRASVRVYIANSHKSAASTRGGHLIAVPDNPDGFEAKIARRMGCPEPKFPYIGGHR